MNDGYTWWLVILGVAIGVAVVWLLAVRLPRRDDDMTREERLAEARWIGATIERDGGIAPQALVEEILDLHRSYLANGAAAGLPPHDRAWADAEPRSPDDRSAPGPGLRER